ncbi:hypothetical protein A2U01_0037542, partial [Trifolium medium]|nr:hypothetical protein [Trifolium medium]
MWLNCSLSIREVGWLLEELSRNHAYFSLVSSDSGPAVDMVKNWTEENYVLPVNRDLLPWVEVKIEGVPSKYSSDDLVSNLGVKCLFDVIGICFPLSSFEVGVINHLCICPSQLHPLSWALVRAFAF